MLHPVPLSAQVRKSTQGGFIADMACMDARGFRKIRGRCDERDAYGHVNHTLVFGADRMEKWSRSPQDAAATPNCIVTLSQQPADAQVRNVVGLLDLEAASDDELDSLLEQVRRFSFRGDLLARAFLVNSRFSVFWSGVSSAQLRSLSGSAFRQALLKKPTTPRHVYDAISGVLDAHLVNKWRLVSVCLGVSAARALAKEFDAESDFDRFLASCVMSGSGVEAVKMLYVAELPILVVDAFRHEDEVQVFMMRGSGAYETSMKTMFIPAADVSDVAGWNVLRSEGHDPEQTRRILLALGP